MYHLTNHRNVDRILEVGLLLSDSGSPYIWLFDSLETAKSFMSDWWDSLFEVDASGHEIFDDPHPGFEGIKTFIVKESISKDKIHLLQRGRRTVWTTR